MRPADLARAAGTGWQTVQRWTLGARPNPKNILAIAENLKLSMTERAFLMELAAKAPGIPNKRTVARKAAPAPAVVEYMAKVAKGVSNAPPARPRSGKSQTR